jgi:hypothetical protein
MENVDGYWFLSTRCHGVCREQHWSEGPEIKTGLVGMESVGCTNRINVGINVGINDRID